MEYERIESNPYIKRKTDLKRVLPPGIIDYKDVAFFPYLGNDVEVRGSTLPNAGNGLFAMRDFEIGEIVTNYRGDVIPYTLAMTMTPEESTHLTPLINLKWMIDGRFYPMSRLYFSDKVDEPEWRIEHQRPMNSTTVMEDAKWAVIGGGAFANDASGVTTEGNNTERFFIAAPDFLPENYDEVVRNPMGGVIPVAAQKSHLVLRATRKIKAGDEIFFENYQKTVSG